MIERFFETEQNMLARFCGVQIKLGAATNHDFAVSDKCGQDRLQGQCFRYAIDECHHVVMKSLFELCVLV